MQSHMVVEVYCAICSHCSFVSLRQPYYWHECDSGNVCHVLPRKLPKSECFTLKEVKFNAPH